MTLVAELGSDRGTSERAQPAPSRDSRPGPSGLNLARFTSLIALGLFAALCAPALCGLVYTANDLGAFHLPLRDFYARALASGDAFDWCGQLFGGFYLTGEGQAGGYHPLHWVLYRYLPLPAAWDLECVLSYPWMFAGLWLLLRRRKFSNAEAVFGAMAFSFCGFNLLHFVHVNAISVIAHVPWLLWSIDGLVEAHQGRRRGTVSGSVVWIAALTASQILLGYPQYVVYSLLAELLYFVLASYGRTEGGHAAQGKVMATWALAKALGVVLGAVQLLPTLEALADSVRQNADGAFSATGSLHPLNFIQLVAPYLLITRVVGQNTHELGCYVGVVPLLLSIVAIANRRSIDSSAKALRRFAVVLIAVGVLIALGGYGPVQRSLAGLPLVGAMRFPCRAIVLVYFGASILAALGFWLVSRNRQFDIAESERRVHVPRRTLAAVALASIALAIGGPFVWAEYTADVWRVACGPVLMLAGVLLVARAASGRRWALYWLVVLCGMDLGLYGMSYSVYRGATRLDDYIADNRPPLSNNGARIALDLATAIVEGVRAGNQVLLAGYSRIDGYVGLEPLRVLDYRDAQALRLAGVQYIRAAAPVYDSSKFDRTSEDWLALPGALPRARVVRSCLITDSPNATLSSMDLANEVLVAPSDSPAITAHFFESSEPLPLNEGTDVLIDRPGFITVRCVTAQRAILVLSESFHTGWAVRTNGSPSSAMRVNGDFLGCVLEPGCSTVEFRFAPASLRYGRLASLCGLSLWVMLLGACLRPRMRGSQDS